MGRSLNVVLVRPESLPGGPRAAGDGGAGIEAAAGVLRRAAGISASYVVVTADPLSGVAEAQADALLSELGSLRHGPWWPSLADIFGAARGFYPGLLGESQTAGQASLLS